jgi:hypothetical protein
MLEIAYHWTHHQQQDYAQFETGIGFAGTLVDFYMFCRQICYETLERSVTMLGGPGLIVGVDEAKFGRRKFNRGKRVEGVWIFGIVERGSRMQNCALMLVPSRDKPTLFSAIQKFIAPGTTIYSDCWGGYDGLEDLGYTHQTVNHSKCFKDP